MVAEHGEVIQSLFEAFRSLAEEAAKKDKRIDRLERESEQLKQFVFLNVIEGLNQVKDRILKFDRIDNFATDLQSVKSGLDDLKFSYSEAPAIGTHTGEAGQMSRSLATILTGVQGVAAQRNADVEAINANLQRLEERLRAVGERGVASNSPSSGTMERLTRDLEAIRMDQIPDMESDWAAKWANLSGRIGSVDDSVAKVRNELIAAVDKAAVREGKLTQLHVSVETGKRSSEKVELSLLEVVNKMAKLETDMAFLFEEIKRIDGEHSSVFSLEAKVELGRAECKSNFERVQRVGKQDLENVRIKVERLAILKDELERIKPLIEEFKSGQMVPPLVQNFAMPSLLRASDSPLSESSLLSLVDEGIAVAGGIRVSDNIYIPVPTGGAESGTIRTDGVNRLSWRIDNMAAVVREPTRWPNIFVSPQFEQAGLVGRLKLFPTGSDQSRIEGNCSMYLRCLPGVVVRFAIELGGEVVETFECEYEKQRDKGKHDFVKLNEYIAPDGSLTIGLEIRSIRPI